MGRDAQLGRNHIFAEAPARRVATTIIEANATFIVQACNAHDELVAALGDAIIQVHKDARKLGNFSHGRQLQSLADKWSDVFNRATARTAFAKARP